MLLKILIFDAVLMFCPLNWLCAVFYRLRLLTIDFLATQHSALPLTLRFATYWRLWESCIAQILESGMRLWFPMYCHFSWFRTVHTNSWFATPSTPQLHNLKRFISLSICQIDSFNKWAYKTFNWNTSCYRTMAPPTHPLQMILRSSYHNLGGLDCCNLAPDIFLSFHLVLSTVRIACRSYSFFSASFRFLMKWEFWKWESQNENQKRFP